MTEPYLRDHQQKALKKLTNGKILWGGVGTGKSRVAATYYKEREAPKHVYVITTAKKRDSFDWQEEFYRLDIGPKSGPTDLPGASKRVSKRKNQSGVSAQEDGASDGRSDSRAGLGGRSSDSVDQGRGQALSLESDRDTGKQRAADAGNGSGSALAEPSGLSTLRNSSQETNSISVTKVDEGVQQPGDPGTDARSGHRDSAGRGKRTGIDDQREDRSIPGVGESGENLCNGSGDASASDATGSLLAQPGTYPYVLTVDSWNNVNKYAGVEGAFFIFDEQRLVGSGLWTKAFLRIARRNNWILLSGTPGDTWMDYIPVFVANGFYKNRSEFKREHVVYNTFTKFPKVDRYINVGRLVRQRSQLLVEMPYVRHTRRRHVEVPLQYDKEALDLVLTKRWHVYEDRPLRDVGEMFSVARRVVNSDPSRLEMVKELWKNHPKLIVFYNFNYELEALRSLTECFIDPPIVNSSKRSSPSGSNEDVRSAGNLGASKISRKTDRLLGSHASPVMMASYETEKKTSSSIPGMDGSVSRNSTNSAENSWTSTQDSSNSKPRNVGGKSGSTSTPVARSLISKGETEWTSSVESRGAIETKMERSSSTTSIGEVSRQISTSGWIQNTGILRGSETMTSIAEWNGHKHQPIPDTSRWIYLVQYIAGAEAWECIETDAMIMYSRNYSWKLTEQAYGRNDRLNTPFTDLWYYDFTSDSWIDRAIERSLKAKETFNEAKYAKLFRG